ncbi:hypothetical protein HYX17_05525 [Candidatus Woesearchaeota archaeon]|nr:hypothetical protein [Candidatus Woesearchaeota archaeon]
MKQINLNDYEITFRAKGTRPLFTDILAYSYNEDYWIFTFSNNIFTQRILIKFLAETNKIGLSIYGSKVNTKKLGNKLERAAKKTKILFEQIKTNKKLIRKEIKKLFDESVVFFDLFRRMDHVHTDKAFSLSKKNKIIAENLKIVDKLKNSLREVFNDIYFGDESGFEMMLDKLSKQFKVEKEILHHYTIKEILDLFKDKKASAEQIKNRKKGFIVYTVNGNIHYLEGDEAIKTLSIENVFDINQKELKGVVANPGKENLKGIVRVINVDYADFKALNKKMKDMKNGEILVAETTAPELMIACKKASVIITDMGGMLSHAAIVSRELRIPCIVDTKNATKILKTGDLVEIDANKGIIKILRR